jgi:hypothetical protein
MVAVSPSTAATAVLTVRSPSASNFPFRHRLAGAVGEMLVDASVGPWAPCRFPSHTNSLRKLPGLPIGLHQFAEPALSRLAYFGRIADQLAARTTPSVPVFTQVRALIDKGRTWIKLSGAYISSKVGPPTYADLSPVARAYVKAAPERMVWGRDWPHPSEPDIKPDDAVLFDLLAEWAPDEAVRHRILVENPQALYGFPKSA